MPADEARRLEELALNASGAFQSLVYDGWLLGYRPGPTKRLRCVNPFYPSSLPVVEKVAYCASFYRGVALPPLFRLLPFSQPPELDRHLEAAGWVRFEPTLVMHADLAPGAVPGAPAERAEIVRVAQWVEATATLLDRADGDQSAALERARTYPLPHVGAVIRRDGDVVACGLAKFESDAAGLFAVVTAEPARGQGLGRAIVHALLTEARRHGARRAYLQVTAANAPALALYRRFGFVAAYDYWYRGLDV